MLSLTWTIDARYREPSDYDPPDVQDWVVGIDAEDRVIFADPDTGEPFIRTEDPGRSGGSGGRRRQAFVARSAAVHSARLRGAPRCFCTKLLQAGVREVHPPK